MWALGVVVLVGWGVQEKKTGGDRTTKRPLTPIPSASEALRRDWPVRHEVDLNRLARNRTDANAELAQVPV